MRRCLNGSRVTRKHSDLINETRVNLKTPKIIMEKAAERGLFVRVWKKTKLPGILVYSNCIAGLFYESYL